MPKLPNSLHCRMCWRIARAIFASIILIEAAILVPSYRNYERDLLLRLENVGLAAVSAALKTQDHAAPNALAALESSLTVQSGLKGAAIYDAGGRLLGSLGEPPELILAQIGEGSIGKARSTDGQRYDVAWRMRAVGLPVTVIGRLDSSWIGGELVAFLWRIAGLVLLISAFVCGVTMVILGRSILKPLLALHGNLAAAGADPANADQFSLRARRDDELGDVIEAINELLRGVSRTYREELAMLAAMANESTDAILAYDAAGHVVYANRACLDLCGFADAEAMERANLPLLAFEGNERPLSLVESLREGPYSSEATLLVKGGHGVPCLISAARLESEGRRPVRYYAIVTDISALSAAQERIVELARFPDENPNPVLRVKPDGTVRYANQAAREVAELFAGDGQVTLAGGLAKEVAQALETGSPREVDFVAGDRTLALAITPVAGESYLNLYGRDITLRKQAEAALREANDTLEKRVQERTGALKDANRALLSEITERKRAEEALARFSEDLKIMRDEAELASRSKSEFLANMSHELRTPLNAIIGFSEMTAQGIFGPVGDPKYIEYARDINASGLHLLDLINDILDLSKIEAGKLELQEQVIDFPRIVKSCLTLVRERGQRAGLTIETQIPDGLPLLRADDRKLKQIVINLLSNAIKFTPTGGTVVVAVAREADDGFTFRVSDNGIGMTPEDIATALEPFGQVDSKLSRKYQGTGLGLPLTKALVELHGGALVIESEPGVGTTVTVCFPAARVLDKVA